MSDQLACVKPGQYPQGVLEVMLQRTMGSLMVTQCPEVLGLDGSTPPNLPGLRTKKPKERWDARYHDTRARDRVKQSQQVGKDACWMEACSGSPKRQQS